MKLPAATSQCVAGLLTDERAQGGGGGAEGESRGEEEEKRRTGSKHIQPLTVVRVQKLNKH